MIEALEVFKAFAPHRDKAIVIATGTSGKHWRDVSKNEARDMNLGGAMGHTTSAAFGLAMGLPNEKVVLFDAEGALLMNLGVLATVAGKKPKNFVHFLLDNGCYATTGGQPVPNSEEINYAGMAREAGYAVTYEFRDLEEFTTNVGGIMEQEGPVFVSVKVIPEVENMPIGLRERRPTRSRGETVTALRNELGIKAVYGE
jgi:thiamine pyrophosphate-dependent acetolactate synthase large subunit-like protein